MNRWMVNLKTLFASDSLDIFRIYYFLSFVTLGGQFINLLPADGILRGRLIALEINSKNYCNYETTKLN